MKHAPRIHKIAFVGDHLPRKCGIATFTTDLLAAVQDAYPHSRCVAAAVNDTGYVHNVVFSCGAVPETDGTVKIYWSGADTLMCVGEAVISDLVDLCLDHGRPTNA